jgi:hypothetical protein
VFESWLLSALPPTSTMNSPWRGPFFRLSLPSSTVLSAKVGLPTSSSASSCRLKRRREAQMERMTGRKPEKMAG